MYLENFEKIRKSCWQIVSLGLLARILKLIQGALLAYFLLGSHNFLGEYELAFSGSMLVTGFLMTGIHFALIPTIQLSERENGKEGRMETSNKFLNAIVLISLALILAIILLAPRIINYIDPNLNQEQAQELAGLLRLGSPIISLHFIRMVGVGYLQSDNRFIAGAKSGVANGLVYLAYILIFRNSLSPSGLILAGLLAVGAQIYLLFKAMYGDGYRYKFEIDFQDEYVRKALIYMLVIGLSILVGNQINKIDEVNLKGLGTTYSLDDLAGPLYEIENLFLLALITTLYPILSKNYIDGRADELKEISKFGIYILLLVGLPIGLGLAVVSDRLVNLKFINHGLDPEEIKIMSRVFRMSVISMLASIFYIYTTRFYYTIRDYKMPFILGLVYIGLNYMFSSILVSSLGSLGLVLAKILALSLITGYSIYDYNKRIDFIDLEDFKDNMLIILGSLLTMLVFMLILKMSFDFIFEESGIRNVGLLVLVSFGGGLVYYLSIRESLRKLNKKEQLSNKKRKR